MSTLSEIEAAVAALPDAEREVLVRRLVAQVEKSPLNKAKLVVENGFAVLVAPPGAPDMTPELVKALRDDLP